MTRTSHRRHRRRSGNHPRDSLSATGARVLPELRRLWARFDRLGQGRRMPVVLWGRGRGRRVFAGWSLG